MRAFLSGATGFIGRGLAASLVEEGHDVVALARDSSDVSDLVREGVSIERGDVTDAAAVNRAMRGCEVAFHLAAPTRQGAAAVHRAVSVGGAENVLRAAATAAVRRVVHCSTAGVHGRLRRLPGTEEAPFRPLSVYHAAKAEAERRVVRHVRDGRVDAVIARPTAVYGRGDLRALPLFRSVVSGRVVTVGSGRHPYHMVYVDDVVRGLRRCADERVESGQAYLLAGPEASTVLELMQIIADAAGVALRRRSLPAWPFRLAAATVQPLLRGAGRDMPYAKTIHFFTSPRAYDISKAARDLGHTPEVSLAEGVRRTLDWYREAGHLPAAPRDADGSRRAAEARAASEHAAGGTRPVFERELT